MLTCASRLSLKQNWASLLSHSHICLKPWKLWFFHLFCLSNADPGLGTLVLPLNSLLSSPPSPSHGWCSRPGPHGAVSLQPPTPHPPDTNSGITTSFTWGSASKYEKHTIDLTWLGLSSVLSRALEIYIKAAKWKGTSDQQQIEKNSGNCLSPFLEEKRMLSHSWQLWIMVPTLELDEYSVFSGTMW